MKLHRWLGYLLIATFAVRAATLFPFSPPDMARQLMAGVPNLTPEMLSAFEAEAWVSLYAWSALLFLGVVAGVMLIRKHSKWPLALLASAAIYLLFLPPWRWLALHADLLRSAIRVEHFPSMWQKPGFVFDTLVFPSTIVVATLYAVYVLFTARKRHAI